VYIGLQAAGEAAVTGDVEAFARQYDRWRDQARFPRIVKSVYLAGTPEQSAALRQFDTVARTFVTIDWPEQLAAVRRRIQPPPAPPVPVAPPRAGAIGRATGAAGAGAGGSPGIRLTAEARAVLTAVEPMLPSVPALVIALPSFTAQAKLDQPNTLSMVRLTNGHIVVELDRDEIRQTILPELVAQRFPAAAADEFRFALIDPARPTDPIYSRGLEAGHTLDPRTADAAVPLFTLRLELANDAFVRQLTAVPLRLPAGAAQMFTFRERDVAAAPSGARPPPPAPVAAARGGSAAWSQAEPNVSIVVQTAGRTERTAILRQTSNWQLVFQHTAGSLDAAVTRARRRNLWLSFSILSVLAAGVVLVVVNAHRSQRLAAQQMDFVATVSHELRTPLTVIRSAAQNLSAGVVHDASQARRYGDLIETEGRRLTDMVEQVLEYAGLSGNRQPQKSRAVDAGATVADVVSASEALFENAGITPVVEIDRDVPPVVADDAALRRAVSNLIANAIKHGADGRSLSIAVRAASAGRNPEVTITVADRGRGIDPVDLPHVFEPFYRGRYALERQIQGNGLGLSLVRRIAEAHGGRVTVTSAPGQGAAFTIHLPAASAGQSHAAMDPAAEPAGDPGLSS
jgi:signal transduction histidine kinase